MNIKLKPSSISLTFWTLELGEVFVYKDLVFRKIVEIQDPMGSKLNTMKMNDGSLVWIYRGENVMIKKFELMEI